MVKRETDLIMKRWHLPSAVSPSRLGLNLFGVRRACITNSWFETGGKRQKVGVEVVRTVRGERKMRFKVV